MSYRKELIEVAAVALAAIQNLDDGDTDLGNAGKHPECMPTNNFTGGLGRLLNLLDEVMLERFRQEKKWNTQCHTPDRWMVILMEEVGEANRAILENDLGVKHGDGKTV